MAAYKLATVSHIHWYLCTLHVLIFVPSLCTQVPSTVIWITTSSSLRLVTDLWLKSFTCSLKCFFLNSLVLIMLSCSSRRSAWCPPCTTSYIRRFAFGPNLPLHLLQHHPVFRHWLSSSWLFCQFSPVILLWLLSPWSYCQLSSITSPTEKHLISAMSSPLRIIQPRMSHRATGYPSLMNIILLIPCVCSCPSNTQLTFIHPMPPVELLSSYIYLLPWILLQPSLFNKTTLISV